MKKLILSVLMVISMFMTTGCMDSAKSSDKVLAEQTEQIMKEANSEIGMPNINNFQQKKQMKMIFELCDQEDIICYAYLKNDMTGELVFLSKCMGYGIPFSAQFTNPMKVAFSNSQGRIALPQADPNGLFMPTSSSATWLMLIDPKTNEPHPAYIEPEIVVSPFKLH